MAYGFLAYNDNNQVLFSDVTYTLEYYGKASYVRDYGTFAAQFTTFSPYGTLYNRPLYNLIEYYIDIPPNDLLAFAYIPNPYFTGILFQQASGSGTTMYAIGQVYPTRPTIYCFRKAQPVSTAGKWGINLFDASGNVAFSSQTNMLIPKAASNVYCRGSNLILWNYGSGYIDGNGPSYSTQYYYPNNMIASSSTSISKPAFNCYSVGTATTFDGTLNRGFWELGFRYNTSTNKIDTQWGRVGESFGAGGLTRQIPDSTNFMMVIDGANYD